MVPQILNELVHMHARQILLHGAQTNEAGSKITEES